MVDAVLAQATRGASAPVSAQLARFRDVYAIDGTLIRLHRKLQKHFRGFRSKGTEAVAKLHVVHNLSRRDIERLRLSGARVPDVRGVTFGRWVKGALSLFDLGYYSHAIFRKIRDAGGFFVSRMKSHANPLVVSLRHGRKTIPLDGIRLKDLKITEDVLDVDARFGRGKNARTYRVSAVREPVSGTWRYYVTNLSAEEFPAEEIAAIYRLRWEIELLFRELKSAYRLDEVTTTKPATARCLILAALLSLLLGRVLTQIAAYRADCAARTLSPRRVAAVLAQHALDLGRTLLAGNAKSLGRCLARVADVCIVVARAVPPRGGARALSA